MARRAFRSTRTRPRTARSRTRCAAPTWMSANTAATFGDPAALDPTKDPLITGGTAPIFTASDFQDGDVASTATIMKLVIDGYAGAGTIAMGGYDYHDGTRASGEMRNFKAGQMIGAVLEYAQRVRQAGDDLCVQRWLADLHRHAGQQCRRARQARLAGRQRVRLVDLLPGVQPQGTPAAAQRGRRTADRLLQRRWLGGRHLQPRRQQRDRRWCRRWSSTTWAWPAPTASSRRCSQLRVWAPAAPWPVSPPSPRSCDAVRVPPSRRHAQSVALRRRPCELPQAPGARPHFTARFVDSVKCAVQFSMLARVF